LPPFRQGIGVQGQEAWSDIIAFSIECEIGSSCERILIFTTDEEQKLFPRLDIQVKFSTSILDLSHCCIIRPNISNVTACPIKVIQM